MELAQSIFNCVYKQAHNYHHPDTMDGWSHICGGIGGQAFERGKSTYSLLGVRGQCGAFINRLEFLFIDVQTHKFYQSTPVGTFGGQAFEFTSQPGERIVRVYVWADHKYVHALQFMTSSGRQSKKFGGEGGKKVEIDAWQRRIYGVKGRFGKLIDQICFGIATLPSH